MIRHFLLVTCLLPVITLALTLPGCRCFPGDDCWPSDDVWAQFNQSINGRLVQTQPLGTPCHEPHYNFKECTRLKERWHLPEVQYVVTIPGLPFKDATAHVRTSYTSSSSIMAPFFANGTCDPYHPISKSCTLRNYVLYSVNVTTPVQISETLQFATKHNIRVVVRNTAHDILGKSTGAGALAIWTHYLKHLEIQNYSDQYYSGQAVTAGAGIQGFEVYDTVDRVGLQVVGGGCPSVGFAGGYGQGGGHSMLSSRYGLAADQVLKWEVIDGVGRFITATRDNEHSDLYWALSGGGGGTYGVVWSMTSKLHKRTPISWVKLSFTNANIIQDVFYEAISIFHTILPALVDAGATSHYSYTKTAFSIPQLIGPEIPEAELLDLLEPFTTCLKRLNVTFTISSGDHDSYWTKLKQEHSWDEADEAQFGGWLIPRSVIESNNQGLMTAHRQITEAGSTVVGIGLNVGHAVTGDLNNSVLPAWREALIHNVLVTPWKWDAREEMLIQQKKMTEEYVPKLMEIAPTSGAYMNEGDFRQPNFQQAFYGRNYEPLYRIKGKYDPNGIFYARTGVGSDKWVERDDGRLCPIGFNHEL